MEEFLSFKEELDTLIKQQLDEKLIMYNSGKRYGQVVFLAGGAGSGKGFALEKFMEGEKFKVRDVDAWKQTFLKLSKVKKKYADLKSLDLKNPEDVSQLHQFVKQLGIKDKTLELLLKNSVKDRLPNIIFDITFKDFSDIEKVIPLLMNVGYESKNIHLTWILTNYKIAVKRNLSRSRIVAKDILLGTHKGAADNMISVVKGKLPKGLDGEIRVILNNQKNTIFAQETDRKAKNIKQFKEEDARAVKHAVNMFGKTVQFKGDKLNLVKSFTYITLKKSGKRFMPDESVKKQVAAWIVDNVPKDAIVGKILS